MLSCPADAAAIINARPREVFIADLFTFQTIAGNTFYYTNSPRPITVGGITYPVGSAKLTRGRIQVSRGISVDSHQLTIAEQNGPFLEALMFGAFNRAVYTLSRTFAASASSPWSTPVTRFVGRVASIDEIGYASAKITVKSMLYDLDNDFPRVIMQASCPNTLFDAACGLSRSSFLTTGTVGAGSTQNTIRTGLSQPDGYFTLGIITFTSGALSGISYMIRSYAGGVISPAYPLMTTPQPGDTFNVSPGCDKTLTTCTSRFGYNASAGTAPYFRGLPFVPDPVCTY